MSERPRSPAWPGRRVLVTGARGFVGSRLCQRLTQLGAEVHATSRTVGADADLRWCPADLRDAEAVRRVLERSRPEVVFHLGGHVSAQAESDQVAPTMEANLGGTVHLLTAACSTGRPRVIVTGSLHEPEGDATPSSPYAAAKAAITSYARLFRGQFDLPIVLLRPFMIYGPSAQEPDKLVPHVIAALARDRLPELGAAGRALDWVYLDDVVDAYLLAADAPNVGSATLDLGSGARITTQELVAEIAAAMGKPAAAHFDETRPDRPHPATRIADTGRTWDALRWRATTSLSTGLRATIEFYRGR